MRSILFISMSLLAAAPPLSAKQVVPVPPGAAQFGALRPRPAGPYSKLFKTQDLLKRAQPETAQQPPKTTRVCGMTIIEANPFFDQKMKVTPPKDANVRYTIRAVDPPVCTPLRK